MIINHTDLDGSIPILCKQMEINHDIHDTGWELRTNDHQPLVVLIMFQNVSNEFSTSLNHY